MVEYFLLFKLLNILEILNSGMNLDVGLAHLDAIDNLHPLFCCKVFNTSEFFVKKNLVFDNIFGENYWKGRVI